MANSATSIGSLRHLVRDINRSVYLIPENGRGHPYKRASRWAEMHVKHIKLFCRAAYSLSSILTSGRTRM